MDNGFNRAEKCTLESQAENSSENEKSGPVIGQMPVPIGPVIAQLLPAESKTQCCGNGLGRHSYHAERMECCADGNTSPIGMR